MMDKAKIAFIVACLGVVGAITVSFSAVTFAYYEKTKVLQNDSSEDILISADQMNYRNVTFTVRAKTTSASKCVYIYDKNAKKVVKMSPVDENREQYTVTYLAKIGTLQYRYFIADDSNPNTGVICEKNSDSQYRSLTIDSSSTTQSDNWICNVVFKVNHHTGVGGSLKVYSKWGVNGDFSTKYMNYVSNDNWELGWYFPQYTSGDGKAYDFKYFVAWDGGTETWENYDGHSSLQSLIGNYGCQAYGEYVVSNSYHPWGNKTY